MVRRLINAGAFIAIYLAFLAWYDGWGMSPLTADEVEKYIATISSDSELYEFRDRVRKMGAEDDGEEIYMLNLNRYQYADDEPVEGLPAAYRAYSDAVMGMILKSAGHPIYAGRFPEYMLTGDSADAEWQSVILVRYRSRRDFISMVASDAYQKIAADRAAGIDYAEVTPTTSALSLAMPRLLVMLLVLLPGLLVDYLLKRTSNWGMRN